MQWRAAAEKPAVSTCAVVLAPVWLWDSHQLKHHAGGSSDMSLWGSQQWMCCVPEHHAEVNFGGVSMLYLGLHPWMALGNRFSHSFVR